METEHVEKKQQSQVTKLEEKKASTESRGFNYEEIDTGYVGKFDKAYMPGRYKTSVIVYEGKVAVGKYDTFGANYNANVFVTTGERTQAVADL